MRNKALGKSHSRQKGRGLHRVWTRSQGPRVGDQESEAAHTNSLSSRVADVENPEADCLGVLSLALAPE